MSLLCWTLILTSWLFILNYTVIDPYQSNNKEESCSIYNVLKYCCSAWQKYRIVWKLFDLIHYVICCYYVMLYYVMLCYGISCYIMSNYEVSFLEKLHGQSIVSSVYLYHSFKRWTRLIRCGYALAEDAVLCFMRTRLSGSTDNDWQG